jgi:hypothetical protein
MFVFLKCFGQAFLKHGLRAVADLVPLGYPRGTEIVPGIPGDAVELILRSPGGSTPSPLSFHFRTPLAGFGGCAPLKYALH